MNNSLFRNYLLHNTFGLAQNIINNENIIPTPPEFTHPVFGDITVSVVPSVVSHIKYNTIKLLFISFWLAYSPAHIVHGTTIGPMFS